MMLQWPLNARLHGVHNSWTILILEGRLQLLSLILSSLAQLGQLYNGPESLRAIQESGRVAQKAHVDSLNDHRRVSQVAI